MNIHAFIFLLLTLIKSFYSNPSEQCTKSNTFWFSVKYPYMNILKHRMSQSPDLTCSTVSLLNCCTSERGKDMASISELKLKGFAEERLERVLMMFSNDSYDLITLMINDLELTKNYLHKLFSTTYGYNYKHHKELFFTWFDKLKLYMEGQIHNIGQLVDNLFLEVAQRMVRLLGAPGSTSEMIACHTTRLLESKPYQDADVQLKKKIVKAFSPARLLINGIAVGRDVFNELKKKVSPSPKCLEQFNAAFHCMYCQGLTSKPCSKSCNVIMENCFGSYKSSDMKKLDRVFTKYIKSLVLLAGQLDYQFNFPEVNNKMSVQISTAIMNIQNMYPNLKDQINAKCQGGGGGLPIQRKRRQASPEFLTWQSPKTNQQKPWWDQNNANKMNEDNKEKKDLNDYQSKPHDYLSPLAKKIKQKYSGFENYFRNQRSEFCSSVSPAEATADCWNGTGIVKNTPLTPVKESKKKGEVIEDPTIKSAIVQLTEITKRIQSYISGANPDPETVKVSKHKQYASLKVNKPVENNAQDPLNAKIEGSGELEGNKFPQPNVLPEKTKKEKVPPTATQKPDKFFGFPNFAEGSGDYDNVFPDENKKKNPKLPAKRKDVTEPSTTSSTSSITKLSVLKSTKATTTTTIALPDDEDLDPSSQESISKNNPPVGAPPTLPPVIQPEGSGNQPVIPDMNPNKPLAVPSVTTTTSSEPLIDGSGEDAKPNKPAEKPSPFLPMLPDQSKLATKAPPNPNQKPDLNPDEDVQPVEGSGKTSDSPMQPRRPPFRPYEPQGPPKEPRGQEPRVPPQEPRGQPQEPPVQPPEPPVQPQEPPVQPQEPTQPRPVTETTTPPVEPLSPDQYPGKIPSEVWLPGLEGAKNQQRENQRTTPSGGASKMYPVVCRTVLILYSIYALL